MYTIDCAPFRTLPMLALLACSGDYGLTDRLPAQPSGEGRPVDNPQITDVIIQTVTPTVDILYMVDNSCSMGNDQDDLVDNFPTFMRWFLGSGLDYHIGVVSSDMVDPSHKGRLQSNSRKLWIETDDPNQIPRFSQMAVLGSGGHFPERGTGGVYFSMESAAAAEFNAGFFRETSAIHTIAVSDEKDYSQAKGDIDQREFINWYDGLKRSADERSFSAIENPNAVSYTAGGLAYADVTRAIGGVFWNISDADWSPALDLLGIRASGRKTEYFLSQLPYDDTIVVTIRTPVGDGDYSDSIVERAWETEEGLVDAEGNPVTAGVWFYVEGRNAISFVELVPPDLAQVVITYTPRFAGFENVPEDE